MGFAILFMGFVILFMSVFFGVILGLNISPKKIPDKKNEEKSIPQQTVLPVLPVLTGLEKDYVTPAMRVQQFDEMLGQLDEIKTKLLYSRLDRANNEQEINMLLDELRYIRGKNA